MKFLPWNDNIVVQRIARDEVSKGGIILPPRPEGESDHRARLIPVKVLACPTEPYYHDGELRTDFEIPREGVTVMTYDHLLTPCDWDGDRDAYIIRARHVVGLAKK